MTDGRLDRLDEKFAELFEVWLEHPPLRDCDCPLYEDEEGRLTQECIASCHNWHSLQELEVEAFDSAVCELFTREGLSAAEAAEFVNLRGKEILFDLNITYKAHGESGWLISWEPKASIALPLPSQATAQAAGEAQRTASEDALAPSGAAYLLWKLLPAHRREDVLGDMEEEFAAKRDALGEGRARRWLWKCVAASVWHLSERLVWKALCALAVALAHWIAALVTGQDDK